LYIEHIIHVQSHVTKHVSIWFIVFLFEMRDAEM